MNAIFALTILAPPSLTVGDLAPSIGSQIAIRGEVPEITKGTHVVMAWATWCEGCLPGLQEMARLAQKHSRKATFTAVAALERTPDPLPGLRAGTAALGDRLPPNVTWEGPSGDFGKKWVTASGAVAYPLVFLIQDGRIRAIGGFGDIERNLDLLTANRLPLPAARKAWEKDRDGAIAYQEDRRVVGELDGKVEALRANGKRREAIELLVAGVASRPSIAPYADDKRFDILLETNPEEAFRLARRLSEGPANRDASRLNHYAWSLIDPDKPVRGVDLAFALRLAQRAAEASKFSDGSILDTYALALWKNGRRAEAIRWQYRAVDLAREQGNPPESLAELESRLKEFLAG